MFGVPTDNFLPSGNVPVVSWYTDETPFQSYRIYVNVDAGNEFPAYECQVLNDLCIWGAADKSHECKDGSRMLSWEFSREVMETVNFLINGRWKSFRNWQKKHYSEVWKD